MAVFDDEPSDWRGLQVLVAQLFNELGCDVKIGERFELVRGSKEIDVYVSDPETAPSSQYLCECKYWARPIPQEVIHSFRTVVADFGAHRGFVISREGFQSGSYEAVENTNIDLVTFPELQEIFFDRWRIAMGRSFMPYADRLFPYWDYPGKMPKFKWEKEHIQKQHQLIDAYKPLIHIGPVAEHEEYRQQFPMVLPAVDEKGDIDGEIRITSYRQLYDFMNQIKDIALHHFQMLYGENDA